MLGWMKHNLESRLLGEISLISDVQMTPPLWQKAQSSLKFNIQKEKKKVMASSPITSWQIDGDTMETVTDLNFLGSKITADGDCSHEIKRHFLFGRKALTNLDSILKKQRQYFVHKGASS